MTLTVTPESPCELTDANKLIMEFDPMTITITVTDETPATPPSETGPGSPATSQQVNIQSVVVPDSGITATINHNVVVLSGSFVEVFSRTWDYRDQNNTIDSVEKSSEIPDGFNTLFRYLAPTERKRSIFATISFYSYPSIQYEIVVWNNWERANNQLKEKVAQGKF